MHDHDPSAPMDSRRGDNPSGPRKPKKDSPGLLIVVGLALAALGGGILYRVVSDAWQGLASYRWSKAEGTVLQSDLERADSTRSGKQYLLKVVYHYTFGGRTYQSDRISYHETWGGGDEAYYRQQLDSKYPRGKPCTVYCNPRDPSVSCLEPGPNYFILILGSPMSLLFLVAGFFLARGGMSGWGRSQEQRTRPAQEGT